MTSLERITQNAQRAANRERQPMAILNLNRVGAPLYVVRFVSPGIESDRSFVKRVEPEPLTE